MTFPAPSLTTRALNGPDTRPTLPARQTPSFLMPQWGQQPLTWINQDQVLGLPGANYCCQLISRAVATIGPPTVYSGSGDIVDSPSIISRPVAGHSPYNVYSEIAQSLIMHGNWVAVPIGDQLVPLPPSDTRIYIDSNGHKRFECGELRMGADEVVHIAMNTRAGNGGIGFGVLNQFVRAFNLQLDEQSFVANTYRNNGVPPAVLHVDVPEISTEQAEETATAWQEAREGRNIAVLSSKFKFETLAWNPVDMELLSSRTFSITELALAFGINPTILGASLKDSMTYENSMVRNAYFLNESVGPYLQVIEETLSALLPGDQFCRFDVEQYQRLTIAERDAHYESAIKAGWLTIDDVRAKEGLAPLGETAA